jgi:hypothetical protein
MKLSIPGCGIALAALVLAAPAGASEFAEANLTNLTLTLQDLTPDDGVAPWIVQGGPPDMPTDSANVYLAGPGVVAADLGHGTGGGYFTTLDAHATLPGVGTGSASISGDIMGGGLNLRTSATLTMPANGIASSSTRLEGGPLQLFTLSPWTTMVLSGTAELSEHGDLPVSWAGPAVALYMVSLPGDPEQSSSWVSSVGNGQSLVQTAALTFENASDHTLQGYFWGYTDAYLPSPAVPEPSTVAMLLAGLGWMGLALRRRVRGTRSATA